MDPLIILIGSGIIGIGVLWFFAYARSRVIGEGLLREAISREPTVRYRVVVPVANPDTQRGLLRLAAATAHANDEHGSPELVAINVIEGPRDAPLQNIEAERTEHQRELLEGAHDIAEQMDVDLRTRAIVSPDIGEAVLDVVDEEDADQLLIGWDGTVGEADHTFGSKIDPILERARCAVSLVDLESDDVGTPVALVAPGQNGAVVSRRAAEFASLAGTRPTLLNVQPRGTLDDTEATERGYGIIDELAASAGLDPNEYDADVFVDNDFATAILTAVDEFDTVCIGLSQRADDTGILYGTITEEVARNVRGNIALVRGP